MDKKVQFDLFTTAEYFDDVSRRVRDATAGARILLMGMTLDPTVAPIEKILSSLESAARQHADVDLLVDAHNFLLDDGHPGPLFYQGHIPSNLSGNFAARQHALQRLDKPPNSRTTTLNLPQRRLSLPVAVRSHIKAFIMDDYLTIASSNLEHPDWINLSAGIHDKAAADWLYNLLRGAAESGSVRKSMSDTDQTYQLDEQTTILVDAGVPNQSIIFQEALALIDSARDWLYFPSQYFPNAVTAQHLLAAINRGVDVEIPFSNPVHHGFVGGAGQRVSILLERTRLPESMFAGALSAKTPMVHAKLIACDKGAMIGSHNYVRAGVRLGTAELALKTTNEDFARRAADNIRDQINQTLA